VLAALSVHDIAAGLVTYGRLSTHADALVGLLLVLLLDRAERALPPGRFAGTQGARKSDADGKDDRGLRGVA
jgi:hypothetical protein